MPALILYAIAALANLLGAAMSLPQALRLRSTGRVEGVSPTWAALSFTINTWWIAYGMGVGDLAIIPVSVISAAGYLYIIAALRRHAATAWSQFAGGLAAALIPLPVVIVGGWQPAGLLLGALYGIQLAPAVRAVYRSHSLAGVSASTWTIGFLEAALWAVYGVFQRDSGIIVLGTTGLAMTGLVLARLISRRPRRGFGTVPRLAA